MSKLLLSEVKAALDRAAERDQNWQAGMCEIAMLPVVREAWRAKNDGQSLAVRRIDGIPHKNFEIPDNRARCDAKKWAEVSGYVLYLNEDLDFTYNGVRDGWYSHSASTTWDGCGRSTYCRVIEIVQSLPRMSKLSDQNYWNDAVSFLADTYDITVVNDLGGSDGA